MSHRRRIGLLIGAIVVVLAAAGAVWTLNSAKAVTAFAVAERLLEDAFYEDGLLRAQTSAAVSAPIGGRVEAVLVQQGQAVREGDLLLVLSSDELLAQRALLEAELEGVLAAWQQSQEQSLSQIAAIDAQKAAQRSADIVPFLDAQIASVQWNADPSAQGSAAHALAGMLELTDQQEAFLLDQIDRASAQTPVELQALEGQLEAALAQGAAIDNQWAQYLAQMDGQRAQLEIARAAQSDPDQIALYDRLIQDLGSDGADRSFEQMREVADGQIARLREDIDRARAGGSQAIDALEGQLLALEAERLSLKEQLRQLGDGARTLSLAAQREQAQQAARALRESNAALDRQIGLISESMQPDSGTGAYYLAQTKRVEAGIADVDRRIALAQVKAPMDGVLGEIAAVAGAYLAPGAPIAEVIDPDSLQVECMVLTADVSSALGAQDIQIIWEKREGDEQYPAQVERVSQSAVPSLSAVGLAEQRVKLWLSADLNGEEADGYQVRVRFAAASERALAVPRAAVVKTDEGDAVYVVREGRAQLRGVTLGLAGAGEVAVLSGLSPGDVVLSDPKAEGIGEGMAVKPK